MTDTLTHDLHDDRRNSAGRAEIREIVERVMRLEDEIRAINSDKSDIFKEAKGRGLNVKALKAVIAHLRKDPSERAMIEADVELYLDAIGEAR